VRYQVYASTDGYVLFMASEQHFWKKFCEALDRTELFERVQDAFVECHGLQCGYCTPGMVMSAVALLKHNPSPNEADIVDALEGNLCRCTGYVNIVAAVKQAATTMAGAVK
jgi:aerobic-type carbon monoxide dehydrogenase small subunit (CoxS/CutS family)